MIEPKLKPPTTMNKSIIFGWLCALTIGAATLTSCGDDEELTDSRLTYYAVLDMQGDAFTIAPIGQPYVDAGCKATLKGEDYTSHVVASGVEDVDVNTPGFYYITYTAVNADGFEVSAKRTVAVCDPTVTADISGTYTTAEGTYRLNSAGKQSPYPGFTVKVRKDAPGIFYVSDILGGYYDQGTGYGSAYAMKGYFIIGADGSLDILSGDVAGWGDSYESFTEASFDQTAGTINYCVGYAGMEFHVALAK